MFIGHFGVALAARRLAPGTSLATLIVGAPLLDLLWPVFLLAGLEHVRISPDITKVTPLDFYDYPFSHSLMMALLWALAAGLFYFMVHRYSRGACVLGALVVSHWVLDYVVHRPDLPLWPGGPKYGLGLWNSWPATIALESLFLGAGIWIYVNSTRSRDKVGTYAFWSLMAFLVVAWGATFGPPPPNVHVLAFSGLAMWILVLWAWKVDSHREFTPRD